MKVLTRGKSGKMIPISKPFIGEDEVKAAGETILSGWVAQGPKVNAFEKAFSQYVGSKFACAVSNCTSALHLALMVVGVRPGNVVITASHSFIATANSIRTCGAEPVFVDIDPKTYNMSYLCLKNFLEQECRIINNELFYKNVRKIAKGESPLVSMFIEKNKSGRVAAVLPVHQMGMPCDIEPILSLAKKFRLPVVEDAACAVGSEIKMNGKWEKIGKPHGDISCFSFHPRKVITTGNGGMITTNNAEYDKKFRLLRQNGVSIPADVRHGFKKAV